MINLLPTDIKKQITFARYNTQVINYALFIVLFIAALIGSIFYGLLNTDSRLSAINDDLQNTKVVLESLSEIETRSAKIKKDLNLVKQTYERESQLLTVLEALEDSIPFYSKISTLDLSQSEAGPLELQFTVPNLVDAAILRNSLIATEKVSAVDIQSIVPVDDDSGSKTLVTLVLSIDGYAPITKAVPATAQPTPGAGN